MKKLLAILLALMLLFTLVACNAESGDENGENTPTEEEEVDHTEGGKWMNVAGANGDKTLKLPMYDNFTSDTVKILNHYDLEQPDPLKPSTFRDIYGLKTESIVVANEDKVSKFISLIMGAEPPDLLLWNFYPSLASKNYAAAWDDHIDFSIGIWAGVKESLENVSMNGKHYFIGSQPTRHGNLVWVNTAIFEDLGVKSPLEYYAEGNWNWDTMRECALATTVDSDSNGEPEIYGYGTDAPNSFVISTGYDFVTYNADGTATNNMKNENVARGVNFYVDLFTQDNVGYDGSDKRDQFAAGKIAMLFGPLWYRGSYIDLIHSGVVDIVPWPRDAKADKYYIAETFGEWILAKDAPNPKAGAALLCSARYDVLNTDVHEIVPNDVRKERLWETIEISDKIQKYMFEEDKAPVLETWGSFGVHKYWGEIWFNTRLGEPWATTAEVLSPKIDAEIAAVLES